MPQSSRFLVTACVIGLVLLSVGCSTYGERVASVPMPSAQRDAVTVDGASMIGRGYADSKAATKAFGFDVRGAGLMPVQFVIDNQSGKDIAIESEQTLLLDREGDAWPLLSRKRAAKRVRATVGEGETIKNGAKSSLLTGLAGAVAGAAVGVVTGDNVGESAGKGAVVGGAAGGLAGGAKRYADVGKEIQSDLDKKSLRNRVIKPGELAHGFLFFPGKEEARSTHAVRLSVRIGEDRRVVEIPVRPAASSSQ